MLTLKNRKNEQYQSRAEAERGDNAADGQLVAQWMDNGDTERELQE